MPINWASIKSRRDAPKLPRVNLNIRDTPRRTSLMLLRIMSPTSTRLISLDSEDMSSFVNRANGGRYDIEYAKYWVIMSGYDTGAVASGASERVSLYDKKNVPK